MSARIFGLLATAFAIVALNGTTNATNRSLSEVSGGVTCDGTTVYAYCPGNLCFTGFNKWQSASTDQTVTAAPSTTICQGSYVCSQTSFFPPADGCTPPRGGGGGGGGKDL